MIDSLPTYVYVVFVLTTFITVALFCRSGPNFRITVMVLSLWLLLQALLSFSGFYLTMNSREMPYQMALLLNSKRGINNNLLLTWNFVCLLLVLNILTRGILSVPSPFQKFGLDQPNTAVLHYPFIWLPACIVPLVVISHLVAIRKLLK